MQNAKNMSYYSTCMRSEIYEEIRKIKGDIHGNIDYNSYSST